MTEPDAHTPNSASQRGPNPQLARFRDLLKDAPIEFGLRASTLESAIEGLVDALAREGRIDESNRDEVLRAVLAREQQQSTTLGLGIAVPHGFLDAVDKPVLAVARLSRELDCGAPDGEPVSTIFLITGGRSDGDLHLELLMSIARLQSDGQFRVDFDAARNRSDVLAAVDSFIARTEPRPIAELAPDGLDARGFANGLRGDVARRLACYVSDFTDAATPKTVATTLFLFFAQVAPTVAFGGLMAQLTDGQIGAMEMIVATAAGGIFYALFGGQPLTILGGTGPMLIFTGVLFDLAGRLELPFLSLYAWVGLWTAFLTVLCALTNASALIRFCTRFTDEIFAVLISLIFIYEAVANIADAFLDPALDDHTSLMSFVLAIATFWVAVTLRNARRSGYMRRWIRQFLADFGSVIAIATATAIAFYFHEAGLPHLAVPDTFATTSGRPWAVDLWAIPPWAILASALPALLSTVLVFLDQNITARLVNQPRHQLKKGAAYHLDLLIVGLLTGVVSLFGLPWLVAATVRSLNHVTALATVEERVRVDGSSVEQIVGVREQRVTGVLIHVMIGLSILILPWMKSMGIEIPMAALFGLFLFMGATSLGGNQFYERLRLWVMDPNHYPLTSYVRRVSIERIHLFTAFQLFGLVVLWVVKTSVLALLFPLFIALLIPLRLALNRVFEDSELEYLDGEEIDEEWEQDVTT